MGYLKFMTDPPSKVVLFIESKLNRLINLLPPQIRYIKETEGIELRKTTSTTAHILPLSELAPANSGSSSVITPGGVFNKDSTNKPVEVPFKGDGQKLGTKDSS